MPYKNKDKQREYQRIWRKENTTDIIRRKAKLKMKYGMSLEDYDTLLTRQKGRCLICGYKPEDKVFLVVDHDHKTGVVRGLLCNVCNFGLGAFKDDPKLLQSAIDYLIPRSYNG